MGDYEKVLRRLIKYRQQSKLTQEGISRILSVTQSQYSKIELGKTIISYNILNELKNHNWDIDFIITGTKFPKDNNEIMTAYEECTEEDRHMFFELFYVVVKNLGIEPMESVINFEWNYLRQIVYNEIKLVYPFIILRDIYAITQLEMADILGVNIKKYRELEKGNVNPDAQLLLTIYDKLGCRPVIFMEGQSAVKIIMGDLWRKIDERRRKRVMEFLNQAMMMLK